MPLISRQLFCTGVHLREVPDGAEAPSRTIRGYAVVFDTPSAVLYRDGDTEYREVIDRGAITDELLARSDIKLTMYHDRQLLLARSNHGTGSLRYGIDSSGVWFETDLPATADGDTARELIARGDLGGCSFMFGCYYDDPECVAMERSGNAVTARVLRIEAIYDFTLAADPAYPATSVALREVIQTRENTINPTNNETAMETEPTVNPAPAPTPAAAATVSRELYPLTRQIREALSTSRHCEIVMSREGEPTTPATAATVTTTTAANAVPVTIQGVIDEIQPGLIWQQLGLKILHNAAGELIWVAPGTGSAKFIGEKEPIVAQSVDFTKISAKAERLAVSFETTYEALYHSQGIVEGAVMRGLTLAAQRAINKVVVSITKPEGSASIQGPFVGKAAKAVSIPANFTYRDLNKLKAALLKAGVAQAPICVLHPVTYCDLEATPKDAGSGIMMIENGRLLGYPVFISEDMAEGYIGMGDFANQAFGFAGDMRLIVDPYTKADQNVIRFTLNFGILTATLRANAFVVGKIATA